MELAARDPAPTGPVLVMFAVPEEAQPFRRLLRERGDRPQRLDFHDEPWSNRAWSFAGGQIWISGMGKRNATLALDQALARRPTLVLTCGFAGGLNPALPTATVMVDAEPEFPWLSRLTKAGAVPSRFCCADRVAVTPADKTALRRETGADAVEMESGVIRDACRVRGIPAATVRVISDAADESLPLDFGALMTPDDRIDFGKLACALIRSPAKIPQLLRFQRRVSHAANALAQVLASVFSDAGPGSVSN
ncbi:MAG TPA: hypothetical protein PLX89_05810 [Verrucomicrobiota bacterium]|nr:hypothetical protein [Verrucomicrobiota bacterium]